MISASSLVGVGVVEPGRHHLARQICFVIAAMQTQVASRGPVISPNAGMMVKGFPSADRWHQTVEHLRVEGVNERAMGGGGKHRPVVEQAGCGTREKIDPQSSRLQASGMTKEEMVKLLRTDVCEWNIWREAHSKDRLSLRNACFSGVDLTGADLGDVDLSGALFMEANLTGANLSRTNLSAADFDRADLIRTNFYKAEMSGALLFRANLKGAELGRSLLNGADLSGADLFKADLFGADLSDSDLSASSLREAKLQEANFRTANLSGADLLAADLSCADLTGAILTGAFLDHVNLTAVTLDATVLADVDLRTAIGLESMIHHGPSTIGLDTIYRSQGKIPESFLREAGIPEGFITQMGSLIGAQEGIQFHSCFISFSFRDEEFARRLHERMRAANLRVWFTPEDGKSGRKLHEQIETQIQVHDKLLLVLSEASMQSEWVSHEIYTARQREVREKRQILFPIALCPFECIRKWKCFDADTGKDMAREVREYLIPDFSTWKEHDTFEAEFKKLLRDLQAETKPPAA